VVLARDVPDLHNTPGVGGEEVGQLVLLLSTETLDPAIRLDGEGITIFAHWWIVLVVNEKFGASELHFFTASTLFISHNASLGVLGCGKALGLPRPNLNRL